MGSHLIAIMLFVLALYGAAPVAWGGVAAQSATPAALQGNPCLDGSVQATTQAAESPFFDYVILLDVSGSMEGWQDDGSRDFSKQIMPAVKDSLKQYLSELPPDSQVTIIPFAGDIDTAEALTFKTGNVAGSENGLADAETYIDDIVADNAGTHITDAITYGLDELAQSRDDDRQHIQTMLLFTDGEGNGENDVDANGDFIVDNLLDAIGEYKREQPYLFVKYVSLGVAVPDAEEMERRGVDVVETAEGVPPVREVRVAIVPDQLSDLKPGVAAANLLCATSGEVGDGLEVVVNDDPAGLPPDVALAFRSEGNTLTADGMPLTYTLAGTPSSGRGPFTTFVEVKSADPEVLMNPSRLPVTFTIADPTPAVTLDVGEFPTETRTRGMDTSELMYSLPLDFTAPDGGAAALSLDTAELASMAPGATAAFVAGDDEVGETATLSGEQPALKLRLTVPAAAIDALADGTHTLPVGIIITPQDAEVTITGADATPQPNGAQRVTPGAGLTLLPQPVCSVEVAPVAGQVLLEGDQSPGAVRWETTVTLTGHDGCAGTLTFDDSALQQAIPGARAAFDVNGEAPLQLDLDDTPSRIVLVVTAPGTSALALGAGDHPQTVALVASTGAQFSPPGATAQNEAGAYAIPVTLPLTIGDRPSVTCQLPAFEVEAIVADGAQEPAIARSGDVTCTFAGEVSVTLRVGETEDGVSASLTTPGGTPGRAVSLDNDHPSATLSLEVARGVPQDAGEGAHTFTVPVTAQASSHDATLELDGQFPDFAGRANSEVFLLVQVAGEKVISIAPIELTPDPVELSTFDTGPDPLEWRGEITFNLDNGADGTLQIDLPADSPVAAFFKVGDIPVAGSVQLAGQSSPLELVVQLPLATAKALPPGSQLFDIPLMLDPTGARIDAPDFVRDGEMFRSAEPVSLLVTAPPVVDFSPITIPPATASTSDDAPDPVTIATDPVAYTLENGAKSRLTADDAALADAYPGASAGFVIGSGEPQPSITLERNDQPVTFVILIPRDALTESDSHTLPAVRVTMAADGDTRVTQGGIPVPEGEAATVEIAPEVSVSTPRFTIDLGSWNPEVLGVRADSSGTGELRWERTLTLSNREDGANPAVTMSPKNPDLTVNLYEGAIADSTLLAEGQPGQPVTATFAPGQNNMIAVLNAPEDAVRSLGLSTRSTIPGLGSSERHMIPATITINPRGGEGSVRDGAPAFREPATEAAPITVEVYEPRNNLIFGVPVLLLLILAAAWAMWPVLPKNAAVLVEGDADPVPISAGYLIGPGLNVDVGSNGVFGRIGGMPGGRLTGNAKFTAGDVPIVYREDTLEPGKSSIIRRDDDLTDPDSNTRITYTRAEDPPVFGDDGSGANGN